MTRLVISVSWTLICYVLLDVSRTRLNAQTYDDVTSLKKKLLVGYDKDLVPVINQSQHLNVTVTFSLMAIPEVDTVRSTITLRAFLNFSWMDEKLSWNPEDNGNIHHVTFPAESVWTPPIFLGSGVTLENIVSNWNKVCINDDGYSQVALGGTFTSICEFSLAFWPFDKQACNLYFVSLTSGSEKVNFIVPSYPVYDLDFIPMGEWTYDRISVSYLNRFHNSDKDIVYTVKIHRQSTFYFLTLILPMHFVSLLGLLVFVIPCDSGERVGFAVTIMLSMVVFMMVVKDEVPKTSVPLPYMCSFINGHVIVAFLANIINLYSLDLFYRDDKQTVGKKYRYIATLLLRLYRKVTIKPHRAENNNQDEQKSYVTNVQKEKLDIPLSVKQEKKLEPVSEDFTPKEDLKEEASVKWKDVSKAIDRLTLLTVMPLAVLGTISTSIYLQAASDYPHWAN